MATAKKTAEVKEEVKEEIIEEAIPEAEKKVTIMIPLTEKEQGDVFVSINERTWLIKRGEPVDVPECVADVIRQSEEQKMKTLKRILANSK